MGRTRYLRTNYDADYQNQRNIPPEAPGGLFAWRYVQIGFEDYSDFIRGVANVQLGDWTLSGGVEWTQWVSRSNLYDRSISFDDRGNYETVRLNNLGLFGEASWQINPYWVTTVGVRADDHTRVGTNVSPRLALNFLPNEREMFRVAVLSGYRLPNTIESKYLKDSSFQIRILKQKRYRRLNSPGNDSFRKTLVKLVPTFFITGSRVRCFSAPLMKRL